MIKKADAKGKEAELRAAFLERLKQNKLLPEDSIYMGDVEALALGKTDKSRTMHDAGLKETVERAHKLLLDTGIWDITRSRSFRNARSAIVSTGRNAAFCN